MSGRANSRRTMRAAVLAIGVATIAASAAAPAFADADDWYHHDRAWREHHWREHQARERERRIEARRERQWRERHAYAYDYRYAPDYYYAPRSYYPRPPDYVR